MPERAQSQKSGRRALGGGGGGRFLQLCAAMCDYRWNCRRLTHSLPLWPHTATPSYSSFLT